MIFENLDIVENPQDPYKVYWKVRRILNESGYKSLGLDMLILNGLERMARNYEEKLAQQLKDRR